MWKDDNDDIKKIYMDFKNIKKFPTTCPICNKKNAHIYMHIYDNETRRGGLWIWCSECHSFSHSSVYVSKFWENCALIEKDELCAIPDYLDEMNSIIDAHVNDIINKADCAF